MTVAPYERRERIVRMRYYNTCHVGMPLPEYKTRRRREPFIRAVRVLCKTCSLNSEASYVGPVLLFLVRVSGRVHSAKTCLFGPFQFEAFIHHHHHVPVSGGFNSHRDSVKPLFRSSLLDRLKRHLGLACSRSTGYLSSKLILYPNSDSTSQLMIESWP